MTVHAAARYSGYRSYDYLEEGKDYKSFQLAPELGRVSPYQGMELSGDEASRVRRLMDHSIVISLHDHPTVLPADLSEYEALIRTGRERTGFDGLAHSGLTAVFDNFMDGDCCITSQMGWKWQDVVADIGMRLCDIAHQDFVAVGRSVDDISRAKERGQVALVPGLEAATMIENELDRLDILYGIGVRQIGIAYSESNALGAGLRETRDGGLTVFGERAVRRMNKLGMAIDISHSGDVTGLDVVRISEMPVLITHAGSRRIWNSPRMKTDEVIEACAARGGIIGLEAAPHTTLSAAHPRHSLDSVMDHFEYLVSLVGVDHVAFGPDTLFGDHVALHRVSAERLSIRQGQGGTRFEPVEYVDGLENPSECFWNITGWLVKHGYSDDDIQAVLGGNAIRVLAEIWRSR